MVTKTKPRRRRRKANDEPTLVGDHLVIDPRVCHGDLTFRGTRVPVATVLTYLSKGHSIAYIRKSWPEVSADAIAEAVRLASDQLVQHVNFADSD